MKIFEVTIKPLHFPDLTAVIQVKTDSNASAKDIIDYSTTVYYEKEAILDRIEMYAEPELFDELGDEIYDLDIEAVEITEKTE